MRAVVSGQLSGDDGRNYHDPDQAEPDDEPPYHAPHAILRRPDNWTAPPPTPRRALCRLAATLRHQLDIPPIAGLRPPVKPVRPRRDARVAAELRGEGPHAPHQCATAMSHPG